MKNITQNKRTYRIPIIALLSLAMGFAACKKEVTGVLPGDKQGIGLNFFQASDVMRSYPKASSFTGIYVDAYIARPIFGGSVSASPSFFYGSEGNVPDFPGVNANKTINYAHYNAGKHHVLFADTTNTVVLDSEITPEAGSYNTLYLADVDAVNGTQAKYQLVNVPEDRTEADQNKVGIRFIHLSPDAGNLECSLQKADGSLTAGLPGNIKFTEASPYQYFDAGSVVSGLLRFTLKTAKGATILTAIPFIPGRRYIAVVYGFQNQQQRLVNAGKKPDGTLKTAQVTVSKNLRAEIRMSY